MRLPGLGTFRLAHFPGLIHFSFVAVSKRRSEQSSGQGDTSFGEVAGRGGERALETERCYRSKQRRPIGSNAGGKRDNLTGPVAPGHRAPGESPRTQGSATQSARPRPHGVKQTTLRANEKRPAPPPREPGAGRNGHREKCDALRKVADFGVGSVTLNQAVKNRKTPVPANRNGPRGLARGRFWWEDFAALRSGATGEPVPGRSHF